MPPSTLLVFYYDCISPFAFLAFQVLRRYEKLWAARGVQVRLMPVLLGGIMAGSKNVPPLARPWAAAQGLWTQQDTLRNRQFFNVPHMRNMPTNFFGPDGPGDKTGLAADLRFRRLLAAVALHAPDKLWLASEAVFDLIWTAQARDDQDNVVLSDALFLQVLRHCGLAEDAARKILATAPSEPVKQLLRKNTSEALSKGTFGVPFFTVEDIPAGGEGPQIYFGSDRFEQMAFIHNLPWYGPDPGRPSCLPAPAKL
eukprot:g59954.t1